MLFTMPDLHPVRECDHEPLRLIFLRNGAHQETVRLLVENLIPHPHDCGNNPKVFLVCNPLPPWHPAFLHDPHT